MMLLLEILATTFTVICVYLTFKQNIWSWLIGIIATILFGIIFFHQELYFQFSLQFLYLYLSFRGWYTWYHGINGYELLPSRLTTNTVIFHVGVILTIGLIVFFSVREKTIINLMDISATALSLLATYYLIYKKTESWVIWMIVNIILAALMYYQGLYILVLLELILFALSFKAYQSWKKII